jgi:hypothetical protein
LGQKWSSVVKLGQNMQKLGMAHGPGQFHFTLSTLVANRRNASARVGRGLGCSAIHASMAAINGGCSLTTTCLPFPVGSGPRRFRSGWLFFATAI